jgi:hypothetical protein
MMLSVIVVFRDMAREAPRTLFTLSPQYQCGVDSDDYEVIAVDATDDGKGRFRLVIAPDAQDAEWPGTRWLRQGVRTKAWVLLRQVPLWREAWRQLNGFPPVVADVEPRK